MDSDDLCGLKEDCKNAGLDCSYIKCEQCEDWFHYKCFGLRDETRTFGNNVCRKCKAEESADDVEEVVMDNLLLIRNDIISIKNEVTKASDRSFASTAFELSPCKSDKVNKTGSIQYSHAQEVQFKSNHDLEKYYSKLKHKSKVFTDLVSTLPLFNGTIHEDPRLFLTECKMVLSNRRLPRNEWGWWICKRMKGTALYWSLLHSRLITPWSEFKSSFLDRFDHKSILDRIKGDLYGKKQCESDDVEGFVTGKILLHRRLYPKSSDNEAVPTIVDLMLPFYRSCLIANTPTNIDDLITKTIALQMILKT